MLGKRDFSLSSKKILVLDYYRPPAIQKFANLNPEGVDTYPKARKLLVDVLESEDKLIPEGNAASTYKDDPMDVDALLRT